MVIAIQVRTLDAELQRRKSWLAAQDALLRDVLPAVYRMVCLANARRARSAYTNSSYLRKIAQAIPNGERMDALLTWNASMTTAAPVSPAKAGGGELHFENFLRGYGAYQDFVPTTCRACFNAIDQICAIVPESLLPPQCISAEDANLAGTIEPAECAIGDGAAPSNGAALSSARLDWDGDVHALQATIAAADVHAQTLWERFDHVLQQAASSTPDVSCALRSRHVAAVSAEAALFRGATAVVRSRQLYSKRGRLITPVSSSEKLRRDGEKVAWCWETEQYERANEMHAVGKAARTKRIEAEEKVAAAREWEMRKAGMSKRERKKAEEQERKDAEAAAVAQATITAAAEEAAKAAQVAEEARAADRGVQKERAYQADVYNAVLATVDRLLDNYVEEVVEMKQNEAE